VPVARLVTSKGEIVVEQVDFTPSPGQVIFVAPPDAVSKFERFKYRVCDKLPEVHHVNPGAGMPAKWMNVVEVEPEYERKPSVVKG
jgi:hypothetical protein